MSCCREGKVCACRWGGSLLALGMLLIGIAALVAMSGCGAIDFQPTIKDPETGQELTADQYAQLSIERERKIESEQAKAETAFKIALAKAQSQAETDVAEVVAEFEGSQADLRAAIDSLRDLREVTMAEFERQRQQRAMAWNSLKSIPFVGAAVGQFQLDPLASGLAGITGAGTIASVLISRAKKKVEEATAARYEDKIKTHNSAWDKSREELRQEMAMLLPELLRAKNGNS